MLRQFSVLPSRRLMAKSSAVRIYSCKMIYPTLIVIKLSLLLASLSSSQNGMGLHYHSRRILVLIFSYDKLSWGSATNKFFKSFSFSHRKFSRFSSLVQAWVVSPHTSLPCNLVLSPAGVLRWRREEANNIQKNFSRQNFIKYFPSNNKTQRRLCARWASRGISLMHF